MSGTFYQYFNIPGLDVAAHEICYATRAA